MRNKSKKLIAIMAAMMIAGSTVAATATVASAAVVGTYTVSFVSNGGSAVADMTVASGATIAADAVKSTRNGYTLEGWYTDAGCTTKFEFGTTTITANTVLYAKWTKATTVAANVKDITYASSNQTFTATLDGKAGKSRYLVEVNVNGTVYTKVFGDGKADSSDTSFAVALAGSTNTPDYVNNLPAAGIALPTLKTTDNIKVSVYTFTTDVVDGTPIASLNEVKTKTLLSEKTVSTVGSYLVTLNVNYTNGKNVVLSAGANEVLKKSDLDAALATAAAEQARYGYEIGGYYTDAACTKEFAFDASGNAKTKITADTALYVKWVKTTTVANVKNISYEVGTSGGKFNIELDNKIGENRFLVEVTVNGKVLTLFQGLGTSVTDKAIAFTAVEKKFDFKNGLNLSAATDMTTEGLKNGDSVKIDVFTYEYKDEKGDNIASKPTDLTKITNKKSVASKTVVYKASYSVTFDTLGGSAIASTNVVPGAAIEAPKATPTKEGFEFAGWYTTAACTTAYDFENSKVTGDITLYAGWKSTAKATAAPTNVTVAAVTDTTAKIKFAAVEGATGYEIYNGETKVATATTQEGKATIAKTVKGLDADTAYTLTVKAVKTVTDMEGTKTLVSDASEAVTATTRLAAPANLKAIKKTTTSLKLRFNAVEGADGYRIYDANGKAIANVSTQNGAQTITKTIKGLKKNTTYKFKVRAYKNTEAGRVFGAFSNVYTKATAAK